MRQIAGIFVLLAALLSVAAAAPRAEIFNPTAFTLANGLQVVVIENHRAPVVTHMVWYKVGAADEPFGKSGIAHLLEHLMFKGTANAAPGEFSQVVARNGGRENAYTSDDFTAYFQTIASDRLELVMRYEADRMANLVLSDEVVLPELEVVREERRSRTDNEPSAQLFEMVRASLFLRHPYGTPVIGWDNELRRLGTADALAFYKRWYAPNNAILIVAGDVTVAKVRELAERYYGPLAAHELPARQRVEEPHHWAPQRVELSSANVGQPSLSIAYLAPGHNVTDNAGHNEDKPGQSEALEVLDEILSGTTGRLYRALVVEGKLAAGAGVSYDPNRLDLSNLTFWASPRPGGDLAGLEAALRAEIAKLLDKGVTAEEVENAKRRLIDEAVFARDDITQAPHLIGRALVTGQSVEVFESWPERIQAVTAEQVDAVLRAVLRDENSVTGVLQGKSTS